MGCASSAGQGSPRTRAGLALHPVPMTRKVAQPLAAALMVLFAKGLHSLLPDALPVGLSCFHCAENWRKRGPAQQKSRALRHGSASARLTGDPVPYFAKLQYAV